MARLVLCVLALCVAGGLAESASKVLPQKPADNVLLKRQLDLMTLFYHTHEPNHVPEQAQISKTWSFEKNIDHFTNITAVKVFQDLYEYGMVPRSLPFSVLEETHRFELETLFNVLYSAKDYETFYYTAVWARDHVNEVLFVYALSTAIFHRHDTQGIVIPPIYEVFPSYFHNAEIMTTAQRINTHGHWMVEHYPTTYIWEDNVVIKSNMTTWPYYTNEEMKLSYFTHDHGINALYWNWNLMYPSWLGGEVVPLVKDRRGEIFWYLHKQLLSRYYMERLSNGLSEIPELTWDVPVEVGYESGLMYHNGIPFPVRPNHFVLEQPHMTEVVEKVLDIERRIRDAIDMGFVINSVGEHININTPEGIDILGRVIEANVDSPNVKYYGDFITLWKTLLGNSIHNKFWTNSYSHVNPLIRPSVLEHFQTALRDPAFYMIWKRVFGLFNEWHQHLPMYKKEELALPTVVIKDVEVDKLVTYFENTYVNVSNHLFMTEHEAQLVEDKVSVLVQRPRLNHKNFQIRIRVNSESAKTVVVRLFLAPKYDSLGHEIPLEKNCENFWQIDQFTYDLVQGETIIKRDSTQNLYHVDDWTPATDVFDKAENALNGKGHYTLDLSQRMDGFPHRLMLPKGRIGGMPFVLMAYISEYRAPKVPTGQGFNSIVSLGVGSGARFMTDDPLGFPVNRPIYDWQIQGLTNLWLEEVLIHHKHTSEVVVPHFE